MGISPRAVGGIHPGVPQVTPAELEFFSAVSPLRGPVYSSQDLRPGVVHLGAGGFFQAHLAEILSAAANRGAEQEKRGVGSDSWKRWGVAAVSLKTSGDIDALKSAGLALCHVSLDPLHPGMAHRKLIGSIRAAHFAPQEQDAVLKRMTSDDCGIVTMTVTATGYGLDFTNSGRVLGCRDLLTSDKQLQLDLEDPFHPRSAVGYIVEAARRRMLGRQSGFTVMSMDNTPPHLNGEVAEAATLAYATQIEDRHPEFRGVTAWIEQHLRFASTMVDRIAPKKPELIAATKQLGVDEGGNSPVPTVATELYRYLVIQETDSKGRPAFPYGRPAWELVEGVLMVDDVEPYSKMKSLLVNSAAHSCSALIGAWGGFGHVHEVMANPQLGPFFKKLITVDTFAAVPKPNDFDTRTYADDVVLRVSNPTMQDELKRLLPNASKQRVAARVVPLLDALLTTPNVDISRGALAYAAWLALDRHGKDWLGRAVPGQIEADPERKDNDARHAAASASVGMAFEDSPVEIGDKAKQRALAQATFKAFHDKPGVLTDSLRRNEQFGRTVVDQLAELYRDTPAAVAAKYTGAA